MSWVAYSESLRSSIPSCRRKCQRDETGRARAACKARNRKLWAHFRLPPREVPLAGSAGLRFRFPPPSCGCLNRSQPRGLKRLKRGFLSPLPVHQRERNAGVTVGGQPKSVLRLTVGTEREKEPRTACWTLPTLWQCEAASVSLTCWKACCFVLLTCPGWSIF